VQLEGAAVDVLLVGRCVGRSLFLVGPTCETAVSRVGGSATDRKDKYEVSDALRSDTMLQTAADYFDRYLDR